MQTAEGAWTRKWLAKVGRGSRHVIKDGAVPLFGFFLVWTKWLKNVTPEEEVDALVP